MFYYDFQIITPPPVPNSWPMIDALCLKYFMKRKEKIMYPPVPN